MSMDYYSKLQLNLDLLSKLSVAQKQKSEGHKGKTVKQLISTDKYPVRFLSIAEKDFTEIISFIATENPTAAEAIANKVEKNLELLS